MAIKPTRYFYFCLPIAVFLLAITNESALAHNGFTNNDSKNCSWVLTPDGREQIERIFQHGHVTVLDSRKDLKVNHVLVEWNGKKVYAIRRRMDRMDVFGLGLSKDKTAQMTRNEYVAYILDRQLDMGMIPVTVLGGKTEDESLYTLQFELGAHTQIGPGTGDMRLFTWITGEYDHENHNVLVDADGKEFSIDHEGMFSYNLVDPNDELPGAVSRLIRDKDGQYLPRIYPTPRLQAALDQLDLEKLNQILKEYVDEKSMQRVISRIRMLR